jgi:heme iron utilization protein
MSSSTAGKHAVSGGPGNQPAVAEPSFAERARTLLYLGRVGSLSTLSRKQQGFPFGSVMPYGLDNRANPVFLISTMAMHTQNIQGDARSSSSVSQSVYE